MSAGARGACKLCEFQFADAMNRMIADGKNQGEIRRAMTVVAPDFYWSRPTFQIHKEHITHPIVTAQQRALANPIVVPKTTRGFLEAVRDIAAERAINEPEKITIDHGLKAAGYLEASKRPVENLLILIAKEMTRPEAYQDADVIVGEYTEEE